MVSFGGQKKAWATPRSVSFRGFIENFRRASPPPSYAEFPPPREVDILNQFIRRGMEHFDCLILSLLLPILTQFCLDYIQCRGK